MVEVFIVIRALAIVVAVATLAIAWIVPGFGARTFTLTRRLAIATGIAAQFGIAGTNVARGREPWTKLLFPAIGAVVSVELFVTGSLPLPAIAVAAAIELVLLAMVVRAAARASFDSADSFLEARLERAFAHVVDGRFARFFALEATVVTFAIRFLAGGFRSAKPAGFGVTRTASTLPLLLALPVFLIPSTIAVDFLIAAAHPLWRLADDALNAYAMLWGIGIYATFRARPHRIVDDTLVASFGAIRSARVPLADIEAVRVYAAVNFDTRRWKKAHAHDGLSFALDGTAVVEIGLTRPLSWPHGSGTRDVRSLVLSADDARELARALAAPT